MSIQHALNRIRKVTHVFTAHRRSTSLPPMSICWCVCPKEISVNRTGFQDHRISVVWSCDEICRRLGRSMRPRITLKNQSIYQRPTRWWRWRKKHRFVERKVTNKCRFLNILEWGSGWWCMQKLLLKCMRRKWWSIRTKASSLCAASGWWNARWD